MATNVGQIALIASIDTAQYKKGAKDIEKTNRDIEGSSEKSSSRASQAWSKSFTVAKVVGVAAFAAVTAAATKAATASWSQVSAVEQATVGLRAYEKNTDKVNAVLADLIKYARSDMGVLFNRKDLFQSAQMLKLNGVRTEDLSKNVQILSRSVGLGLGNWQDLNSVVGRVVSTGRLSGIEFDQLTRYGFKLDKSLRNTNLSAEDLFKTLDKGIPVDAMKGQANTIRGLGIRVESAFRGIGDAILGVDADTSKFIEGGLGDKLTKFLGNLPTYLKEVSKWIKEGQEQFGILADKIGTYLAPKFEALFNTLNKDILPILKDLWKNVIEPLIPVIGTALVVAIGAAIDALNIILDSFGWVIQAMKDGNPIIWGLVGVFGALKAAMAFNAAFNALTVGFNTFRLITIPKATASVTAFRTLVASPMVMGALGVGAAIAAIALVHNKLKDFRAEFNRTMDNIRKSSDSAVNATAQLSKLAREGTPEQQARAKNALRKMAEQGFASGGFTGVGGKYEVAGIVHRGEFVLPKESVNQSTGLPDFDKLLGGQNQTNVTVNLKHSKGAMRQAALDTIELVNEVYRSKGIPQIGVRV